MVDVSTATALQRAARRSGLPMPAGTLAGFVAAAVAVLAIFVVSYRSVQGSLAAAARMAHTLEVIEQMQSLLSLVKDAETGQRGYLLTGAEDYLQPYETARSSLPGKLDAARELVRNDPRQQQQLDNVARLVDDKLQELGQTVALRRAGDLEGALAVVRSGRGKATMDRLRVLLGKMQADEQMQFVDRRAEWQQASGLSQQITTGGGLVLLVLIATAAAVTAREHRARHAQAWLRAGQMGLTERLQGEQRLENLGQGVLAFLADYLDAQVGAVFVADGPGRFRRCAGYALGAASTLERVDAGAGLLGEVARTMKPLHVRDVPTGYLPVASSLGHGEPRELLLAPAVVDGRVQAVLELGFFRAVDEQDAELLLRVSEALGVAIRTSRDRSRLEELLEETQRQAEELQAQQEELRVSNEELEEQSRVLRESQMQLQAQQAELEQTNAQLEEQAQVLEHQKDDLSQAQITLTDKAAELERSNQYKSEFLANMSHELRTPLNSSLILAKLLADNKDGNLSAEQVKFAQTISSAGNDLLALINDILDLSKIESGTVQVEPEPVGIARLVDGLMKTLGPLAEQKGLRLKSAIAPGTPATIESDAQRLSQILKNLLANALKFTEDGEVALDVFQPGPQHVSFTVRDTGIGIPAHQQGLIFEAFRQADGSTHRKYGGTGLGLSISRDLAHLLGGDLAVQSAAGEGSRFTLTLPLAYRAAAMSPLVLRADAAPGARSTTTGAAVPARPAVLPAVPSAPRPTVAAPAEPAADDRAFASDARVILVIEDDVRFAAILRDLAEELGFECLLTHSANEGLAAALRHRPSAILLDMNLPDHSGLGVLDQLKRNPQTRHIPVHVASVADYSQEALARGAIGYALKPVKREQLVDAFRRLEDKLAQRNRRVLVVEDDERQRQSLHALLGASDVQIVGVASASEALTQLQSTTFDCMVMDLNLPDLSGLELLQQMAEQGDVAFPPVIVYTGRSLDPDEEQRLQRYSRSIIIKDARSPERLLDEVTLFLHQVESKLPPERQRMLKAARDREAALEGRCILVVEDDVRNIFALSSVLEPKGCKIEIARNGREALQALDRSQATRTGGIDLVLMDIMMPEMDGFTAMREIRKRHEWKKLPIIALTAKAMKDDQEKCLAAGANDYIAKPLDVEKLLSLVRVWMPQ